MTPPKDATTKRYAPLKDKSFQTSLARRIGEEFPRIGGPRILNLCAEMIIEEVSRHLLPLDYLQHGQAVWLAVATDDPPGRAKRIADTRLVPVILDLFLPEDADDVINRVPALEIRVKRAVRMCRQAADQGALLSNVDLAALMSINDSTVSMLLTGHEKKHGEIVPRRATIHDVGTGLTHKNIICRKRFKEGKTPDVIARETHHSIASVDRYLGQYDRVRHCRLQGKDRKETAYILNCGESLVQQYLDIDDELAAPEKEPPLLMNGPNPGTLPPSGEAERGSAGKQPREE